MCFPRLTHTGSITAYLNSYKKIVSLFWWQGISAISRNCKRQGARSSLVGPLLRAGSGAPQGPSPKGPRAHRQPLPQEPHVGDAVVDLGQHVLQVLGRDPGRAKRENAFRSSGTKASAVRGEDGCAALGAHQGWDPKAKGKNVSHFHIYAVHRAGTGLPTSCWELQTAPASHWHCGASPSILAPCGPWEPRLQWAHGAWE